MRRFVTLLIAAAVGVAGATAVATPAVAQVPSLRLCAQTWKAHPNAVLELFGGAEISYWEFRQLQRDPCSRRS